MTEGASGSEKPLMSDTAGITETATHKTIEDLQKIVNDQGVEAMIATAIGMSYGVAHIFKHLGLRAIYKDLLANLTSFIRRPSGG